MSRIIDHFLIQKVTTLTLGLILEIPGFDISDPLTHIKRWGVYKVILLFSPRDQNNLIKKWKVVPSIHSSLNLCPSKRPILFPPLQMTHFSNNVYRSAALQSSKWQKSPAATQFSGKLQRNYRVHLYVGEYRRRLLKSDLQRHAIGRSWHTNQYKITGYFHSTFWSQLAWADDKTFGAHCTQLWGQLLGILLLLRALISFPPCSRCIFYNFFRLVINFWFSFFGLVFWWGVRWFTWIWKLYMIWAI